MEKINNTFYMEMNEGDTQNMKKINNTFYMYAQNKYIYLAKKTMVEILSSNMNDKTQKFYFKAIVDIYEVITKQLNESDSIETFINKVYDLAINYHKDEVLKDLLGVYHTSVLSYEKNIVDIILSDKLRKKILYIYDVDVKRYVQNTIKRFEFSEEQQNEYLKAYELVKTALTFKIGLSNTFEEIIEYFKSQKSLYSDSWYVKDIFDKFVEIVTTKVVKENDNK